MKDLVKIKNKIRNFIRNFDDILIPVIRLIWSFIVFTSINKVFTYSKLFSKEIFVLLISILCALMPDAFMLFVIGVVISVNAFAVSMEAGLFFVILFVAMYCCYLRFFPKHCYILLLAFVFTYMSFSGILPLFIAVIAGMAGIVPAALGIVIYYFGQVLKDIDVSLRFAADPDKVEVFNQIRDYFKDNKEMIAIIGAFAVTIFIAGIVYRLPFKFSQYIGIGAGAIVNIIAFSAVGKKVGYKFDMGSIVMATLFGLIFVLVFQFCKGFIDYRKTERVQFEDDEYYYYVKAVPKFGEDIEKAARMRKAAAARAALEAKNPEAVRRPQTPVEIKQRHMEAEKRKQAALAAQQAQGGSNAQAGQAGAADKTVQRPAGQAQKPAGAAGQNPAQRPAGELQNPMVQKSMSAAQPQDIARTDNLRSAQKPAGTAGHNSAQRPAGAQREAQVQKPAGTAGQNPAQRPAGAQAQRPAAASQSGMEKTVLTPVTEQTEKRVSPTQQAVRQAEKDFNKTIDEAISRSTVQPGGFIDVERQGTPVVYGDGRENASANARRTPATSTTRPGARPAANPASKNPNRNPNRNPKRNSNRNPNRNPNRPVDSDVEE